MLGLAHILLGIRFVTMSGMSAYAMQKMMHHKNNNVTMGYVAMWGNELIEQNDKHNPLNNLDI